MNQKTEGNKKSLDSSSNLISKLEASCSRQKKQSLRNIRNRSCYESGSVADIDDEAMMVNRLKIENDKLKIENKSFKEMQKLLMKRLKQQDEYMEHCLLIKQQEITCLENLTKKLKRENKLLEIKNMKMEDDISMLIKHIEKNEARLESKSKEVSNSKPSMYLDFNLVVNNTKNNGRSKSASKNMEIFENGGMVVIQEEDESEEYDNSSKRESRAKGARSQSFYFRKSNEKAFEEVKGNEEDGDVKKNNCGSGEVFGSSKKDKNILGLDDEAIKILSQFKDLPLEQLKNVKEL
jgi:hypothetical protein